MAVVLVGCHHVGGEPLCGGHAAESADHVVCLEARDLENRYAVGIHYLLDYGKGEGYVFGLCLALGLVFGVKFMAESAPLGVETHGYVCRILLLQDLMQRIAESEDGRGVEPL